jgi:FAD:protein FMN transferase
MPDAAANPGGGAPAQPSRRRALRILAALAGVPLTMASVRAFAPKAQRIGWRGEVLGALSSLDIWHRDEGFARAAIAKVTREIERLENTFSLHRADSEISRLNAVGKLKDPSPELLQLIEQGQRLGDLSRGAFDITVQPLWKLYETQFWKARGTAPDFEPRAQEVAHALVDFRKVDASAASLAFAKPGMAITLNSMAQGFVTDTVTDILRNEGFESAVIDLGEFRTIGHHPEGRPFRIGLRDDQIGNDALPAIDLTDMALAVSRGSGTVFEPTGRHHHIFDPRTGKSASRLVQVAVLAPNATAADGLATAICAAGEEYAPSLLWPYPGAKAILTRMDGGRTIITSRA